MKYLATICLVFLSSCALIEPDECKSDEDCKWERVCREGSCEDYSSSSSNSSDSVNPSVGNGAECGEVVIDCNCNATSMQPGQYQETDACDSGYAIVDVCDYCQAGYAWYAYCGC